MMPVQLLEIGVGTPLEIEYQINFWMLMACNLLFIAIAKTLNQGYLSVLFSTAIVNRSLLQKTQEELKLNSPSSILLTLPYFINLALLFAYAAQNSYGSITFILLAIVLGSALVKWAFMSFLMFVSEFKSGITEHGMNHLIYYQVAGIILTPILFITHFLPEDIYQHVVLGCLILVALIIILREIQSLGRAIKARISPLYIILYLCTLELVPLILIIYVFVTI